MVEQVGTTARRGSHDYVYGGPRGVTGTIHRADCRTLKGRFSSAYADGDGKTPAQLRAALARAGETRDDTRFCKVCLPDVEPLPEWQMPVCHHPDCGRPMNDYVHVSQHRFVSRDHAKLLGYPIKGDR